jgi:hypothetical protein
MEETVAPTSPDRVQIPHGICIVLQYYAHTATLVAEGSYPRESEGARVLVARVVQD